MKNITEKQINIIGEGIDNTFITTIDATGFYLYEVDWVTLKGFTIDADAQTLNDGGVGIGIGGCNYITLENILVKNGGQGGMDISASNYGIYQNIYIHDSYEHGLHPGSSATAGRRRTS